MICATCGRETADDNQCDQCDGEALLDGRYRLDEIVGRGAAGTTYRATRLSDDETFAVKELDFRRIDSFKTQALFEREAAVLEQLDHGGIPQYVDNFIFGDGKHLSFCLVQEFIEGHTLAEETSKTRYDEREALEILDELLDITTYLHSRQPPVIHRDLKPKNVMRRDEDGSLVVIDFGSVREVLEDPEEGGSTIAGTFGFMAPEQFQGVAMPATDVYGLGALTVSLLSRKRPQEMLDLTNRLHWKPHVNVHTATVRLLERMLEPVYHDRIGDAAEAKRELARVFDTLDGKTEVVTLSESSVESFAEENEDREQHSGPSIDQSGSKRKSVALTVLGASVAFGIGVGLLSGDDSSPSPVSQSEPPSWERGLASVERTEVGKLGRLSLSLDTETVRAIGTPMETENPDVEKVAVRDVVARLSSDCEVELVDDVIRRITCALSLDEQTRGPGGVDLTQAYLKAKYGDGEPSAEPDSWFWTGPEAVMWFGPSNDEEPGAFAVVVQRRGADLNIGSEGSDPIEPGGRNPFVPGEFEE